MLPNDQVAFDSLLEGLTSDGRVSSGMKDALRHAVIIMASEVRTLGESAERYDIIIEKERYFREHHNLITYLDEVQSGEGEVNVEEFVLKFKIYYKAKESLLYQISLALRTILDIHEADLGRNASTNAPSAAGSSQTTTIVSNEFDATSILNTIAKLERGVADKFTTVSNQVTALSNSVDSRLLSLIESNNIQFFNLEADYNAKIAALNLELNALRVTLQTYIANNTSTSTGTSTETSTGTSGETTTTETTTTFEFTGTVDQYIRGDGSYAPFPTFTETFKGTVKSVGLYMPTGFKVLNSPVSQSGTLVVDFIAGYSLPSDSKQAQWDLAYGWGNHASAGYLASSGLLWSAIIGKPSFSTVATSGDYNDLINKPTGITQVNADWSATSGVAQILNKPTLFDGTWASLTGRPTNLSSFTNDLGNYGGWITGINSSMVTSALGYTPYNSSNPSGYITSAGSISGNAATATSAGYASSAGNADTVDGYHGSNYLGKNGNSYYQADTWIQLNGYHGLYAPSYNSAHFSPNDFSYGSWKITGSRNGWTGLHFGAGTGMTLMMNETEFGFYREAHGWYARFTSNTGHFNITGNATTATDATNATHGRYVYDNGTYSGAAAYREASSMHVYYASLGRIVYNNGAYSGSGWVEPSDLGVRYAGTAGNADTVDGYHLDQSVAYASSPTFGNVYATSWFRTYGTNGLYNETHANHWYATSGTDWNIGATGSTASIVFHTGGHQGPIRGHVYANNSNEIGFLNSSGNWSLRTDNAGNVIATGYMSATAFYESSDSRLKQLLQDTHLSSEIGSVKPKLYIKNGREEVGYFAQELVKILPSAVNTNEDGILSLSYTQVHTAKIALLEKKVADLESKLNAL